MGDRSPPRSSKYRDGQGYARHPRPVLRPGPPAAQGGDKPSPPVLFGSCFVATIPLLIAFQEGRSAALVVRPSVGALYPVPTPVMDDKTPTIGLTDLLDEVTRDLDKLRKKHAGDYSIKNLTMWWELERDRLIARHGAAGLVRKVQRVRSMRRTLLLFTAGWLTMIFLQAALRLLIV